MTFVSVAEAARRLGIDAKTLHRWLAQAGLPLQSHPGDGRKKGVSSHHLHLLARLHQRSLAPLPLELPVPVRSRGAPTAGCPAHAARDALCRAGPDHRFAPAGG